MATISVADDLSELSRLNQDGQTTCSTDAAITIEDRTMATDFVFHWIVISLLASLFQVMGAPCSCFGFPREITWRLVLGLYRECELIDTAEWLAELSFACC